MLGRGHCALLAVVLSAACSSGGAARDDDGVPIGKAEARVVGSDASDATDDFVVFLRYIDKPTSLCGAALVAPNVVLTALHCVAEYSLGDSRCNASGEPDSTSVGGKVISIASPTNIGVWIGGDARARSRNGEAPAASGITIVQDGHPTLCSHDIAFVILDKAVTAPVARLRLGKRPAIGDAIAVAGWGQAEDRIYPNIRLRRGGIVVDRVGPAETPKDPMGDLVPRTFEAGVGPCTGDSGSPGFVDASKAVTGVVARALNLDETASSPCEQTNVVSVFSVVTDFPDLLRSAFQTAKAEPWLEGEASPGYKKTGAACSGALECAEGVCAAGIHDSSAVCRVACSSTKPCSGGLVCTSAGFCDDPPPPDASTSSSSGGSSTSSGEAAPDAGTAPADPPAPVSSCAVAPDRRGAPSLIAACALALFGLTIRRRSRSS